MGAYYGQKSIVKMAAAGVLAPFIATMPFMTHSAKALDVKTVYDATIAGIEIGWMISEMSLTEKNYQIKGTVSTSGLAAAFAKFKGEIDAGGVVTQKGHFIPVHYKANQTRRGEKQSITMGYKKGDVVALDINPPRPPSDKRVPITQAHMKQARDPAAALIVTLAKGKTHEASAVCNRTLEIFDANERYQVKLSYVDSKGHKPSGWTGASITCAGRYIPISGHSKGSRDVAKLAKNNSLRISFAQISNTNVFLASELSLKMGLGTLRIKAR